MTHLTALLLSLPRLGAYMTLRLALVILDAAERLRGTPAPPPVLCLGCGKPLRRHAREDRDRCKDSCRSTTLAARLPMPRVPADPLRVPWAEPEMAVHDPAALDAEELATVTGEPAPTTPEELHERAGSPGAVFDLPAPAPAPVPAVERLRACSDFARPKGGREVSEADRCRKMGWSVGTRLVGTEGGVDWQNTTTIEITAVGERLLLAKTIESKTMHKGDDGQWFDVPRLNPDDDEASWTLSCRDWKAAPHV